MGSLYAEPSESAGAFSECWHGCSQAAAQAGGRVESSAKALEQTRALADTLASDKDGKFANSKFLQFVSKMSRGEIILENNEVSGHSHNMADPHTMQAELYSHGGLLSSHCSKTPHSQGVTLQDRCKYQPIHGDMRQDSYHTHAAHV